jgi:PAS domain S-box-containing protein
VAGDDLRVLCVADDPTQLALLERAVGRFHGVGVETAASGAAALSTLSDSTVHCVVCTDAVDDESGLALLDRVRESHAELPFVLFAAEGGERLASEALGRGATDYLRRSGTNPFELLADRAVDYARRYRERAALERSRERYELAGRAVSDVVWERDLDTGTVRWGAGVEATLGYDRDGDYDREWWLEQVHPADRAAVEEAWHPAEAGEADTFECRYRVRRVDGSYASVVDGGEVVRTGGEPARLVGALRDVSERIEQTAELERRNEQLDEFATVVSHDLRNPLNVARGRVELARETGDLDHLDAAGTALERMDDLIADLLTLAREGRAVDELEPVALASLAEDAWATIPNRDAADATLSVETDCRVLADPPRLRQLLENLFANAVEHATGGEAAADGPEADATTAPDGLVVRVGCLDAPDTDGFYVADNGRGIPDDRRASIFDLGHSEAESGDGVGLAIVEEIATAHGWSVHAVDSETGGARFELRDVAAPDGTAS